MRSSVRMSGTVALVVGVLVLGVLIAIPLLLLVGAAEVSAAALGWMPASFAIVAGVSLVGFGGSALIGGKRVSAGIGFLASATVMGALLWIWSLAFTYESWGILPVILGLLLAGVGIVPVALLATVVEGAWTTLGLLLALMACIYLWRIMGGRLLAAGAARAAGNAGATQAENGGVIIEGRIVERE